MARKFKNKKEIRSFYDKKIEEAKERYKERKGLKIARGFYKSPAFNALNYWKNRKLFEKGVEDTQKKKGISLTSEIPLALYWTNFLIGSTIDRQLRAYSVVYKSFGIIIENKIFNTRELVDYFQWSTVHPSIIADLDDIVAGSSKNGRKEYPMTGASFYEDDSDNAYSIVLITV